MAKTIFYCEANFTKRLEGSLLSLAMVCPDGAWFYAESIDPVLSADDFAQRVVVPLMRRIPGTHFQKSSIIASHAGKHLAQMSRDGVVEARLLPDSPATKTLLREIFSSAGMEGEISPVEINPDMYQDFQKHCGGASRVHGHALIAAMGAALCDVNKDVATSFHTSSVSHLELLLGSKNAMSFKAWSRNQEKPLTPVQAAA